MLEEVVKYRKQMKKKLDPMRYEHSLSVSYTCMALAMKYGYDADKAEVAGILHDCAKHFSDEEMIAKCKKNGVELTEDELAAPAVIHAKYGAYLAEKKYGVTDPEILSAIACHTTGKPAMGMLDKILYIADYIEPRRDKASNLPKMRELAFKDLDKALYEILKGTLGYLAEKGSRVDPMTLAAYQYLEKNRKKKDAEKKAAKADKSEKSEKAVKAAKTEKKDTAKAEKKDTAKAQKKEAKGGKNSAKSEKKPAEKKNK